PQPLREPQGVVLLSEALWRLAAVTCPDSDEPQTSASRDRRGRLITKEMHAVSEDELVLKPRPLIALVLRVRHHQRVTRSFSIVENLADEARDLIALARIRAERVELGQPQQGLGVGQPAGEAWCQRQHIRSVRC